MAEVAVIGAGIIGLTIAHRLAAGGHAVSVIAPADEPHMASTGNAGTIAHYAIDPVGTPEVLRDLPRLLFDAESPLAIHRPSAMALAPWLARFAWSARPAAARRSRRALAALLEGAAQDWRMLAAAAGADELLCERGALYLYDTPAALRAARLGLDRRRLNGIAVEMLDRAALEALEPALPRGGFAGAALFPGTLALNDPAAMLARIAAAGAKAGVQRIAARVRGLARTRSGWSLTHEAGRHEAAIIVIAAGIWSAPLARALGRRIPLETERGYHLEFDLPDEAMPLSRPACPVRQGFYLVPMAGRLRAAGTVELGGRDAPPSPHRWERIEAGTRALFPDLPPVARRWMGLRPSLPDSLPVIGQAAPGAFLAFGHGHLGLTLAPRTAALIADLIAGREAAPVLAPLAPGRFG